MKKITMIALIAMLILSGCAAPAQAPATQPVEPEAPQVDMVAKSELENAEKRIKELEAELKDAQAQLKASQDEASSYREKVEAYEAEQNTKENGVIAPADKAAQLHDDEYVTISFLGCDKDSRNRTEIVLLVQNKTDYTLTFQAGSMALDGFDLGHPSGSDEVAPQSKGKIHFRPEEEPESMAPTTFSATLSVIDFSKEMTGKQSYSVTVVNADISTVYE